MRIRPLLTAVVAVIVVSGLAVLEPPPVRSSQEAKRFRVIRDGRPVTQAFEAGDVAEAVLDLSLSAPGANWAVTGSESAVVRVAVDGTVATDIVVTSDDPVRRRVALGRVSRGTHTLSLDFDEEASSPVVTAVEASHLTVRLVAATDAEFLALRHAPIWSAAASP